MRSVKYLLYRRSFVDTSHAEDSCCVYHALNRANLSATFFESAEETVAFERMIA